MSKRNEISQKVDLKRQHKVNRYYQNLLKIEKEAKKHLLFQKKKQINIYCFKSKRPKVRTYSRGRLMGALMMSSFGLCDHYDKDRLTVSQLIIHKDSSVYVIIHLQYCNQILLSQIVITLSSAHCKSFTVTTIQIISPSL